MHQMTVLNWVEAVGWLASILTVATYAMNTMMPLRILAIASSLCFIVYAAILQLWPLLAMELLLLPINLYRLWQLMSLRGKLSRSTDKAQANFSVIRTYGRLRRIKAGTVVFQQGDPVDSLYFLSTGQVHIEEHAVEISAGDIFGEMAFFTDQAERTATARCTEDAQVYEVDEKLFMRLQFEHPAFGMSVMRTITRRLIENAGSDRESDGPGSFVRSAQA